MPLALVLYTWWGIGVLGCTHVHGPAKLSFQPTSPLCHMHAWHLCLRPLQQPSFYHALTATAFIPSHLNSLILFATFSFYGCTSTVTSKIGKFRFSTNTVYSKPADGKSIDLVLNPFCHPQTISAIASTQSSTYCFESQMTKHFLCFSSPGYSSADRIIFAHGCNPSDFSHPIKLRILQSPNRYHLLAR